MENEPAARAISHMHCFHTLWAPQYYEKVDFSPSLCFGPVVEEEEGIACLHRLLWSVAGNGSAAIQLVVEWCANSSSGCGVVGCCRSSSRNNRQVVHVAVDLTNCQKSQPGVPEVAAAEAAFAAERTAF